MGLNTPIEWCDSTVNPTENCDGCELWKAVRGKVKYAGAVSIRICYAGKITERRRGVGAFDEPIKLFPGRMRLAAQFSDLAGKPRVSKPWIPASMPRLIFVSDMSDALSKSVPFPYLWEEIITTVLTPPGCRHIWIWCTKRPARMAEFSAWLTAHGVLKWPTNLWALCSVTDERTAKARIPKLLEVGDQTTIRGISAEPLFQTIGAAPGLDWIIAGGMSGGAPVDPSCFYRLKFLHDQAVEKGIPFFMKQFGRDPERFRDPKGGDWTEWPAEVKRREFPRPRPMPGQGNLL